MLFCEISQAGESNPIPLRLKSVRPDGKTRRNEAKQWTDRSWGRGSSIGRPCCIMWRAACFPMRATGRTRCSRPIEKAWRKADSLREPNKLKPWLVRILVNECHEVLRRRKREIPTENLPEESAPPPQEQRELRELVMSLPENERLPIVLHYLEGFSTQEIASALRCPKGTILSRMSRGRRQLKRFLTEE